MMGKKVFLYMVISLISVLTEIAESDILCMSGGIRMENSEIVLVSNQLEFIDKLGIYYESYGIPKIGGRILGFILLLDRPISAENISFALTISRASVSTNLRLLLNCGFIEKKMVQGVRTDCYIMAKAAWENALTTRMNGFLALMNILDPSSICEDNSSLCEMREWCQMMLSIHEKARDDWKKRGKSNV
jgi:predicted DNA-binding transcriptional regulator